MAKDSTTSARDFLLADSARPSSPRLSDWLLEDLKGPRTSSYPPPPLESGVETSNAIEPEPAAVEEESLALPPPELAEPFAAATPAEPFEDDSGDDQQRESIELAESLSYARASDLPDEPVPPSVPPVSERADTAVYANGSDWMDDDDDEATGFFASAPEQDEPIDGIDEPLEEGASLSPQVLTAPEQEQPDGEDDAVLYVPGVGSGGGRWRSIAAIAAALLVVFLVVHRFRGASRQPATAAEPVAAATLAAAPAADEALVGAPVPGDDGASANASDKKSRGGGFADGLGRSRPSTDDSSNDPAIPGGPHVARFPDLPREILNQLEQVFVSDELKHGKSPTDSVERYTR